ncbi:hypothetical protein PR048_024375 [Dryococelus australis]|uniref:C2H2-type domain-containing protein n=1 Tax=Dryococelus australis TaxID=614101 RepID=A0ABQ9GNE7_9NEOP|nr:hypothetical protein PR048_024375 [Dryococelus australis]
MGNAVNTEGQLRSVAGSAAHATSHRGESGCTFHKLRKAWAPAPKRVVSFLDGSRQICLPSRCYVPPAEVYSHSRRSSNEATRPSPVCSPPCLERNEDSVGNLADCKPEKELVDSDSSSRETVRILTRRRLNRSPMHACKVCSRTFVSWSQLNVHSRSHASDAEGQSEPRQPFTCDLCCKSYALPKHLWTHVSMAHRGDPAITCNLCQRVCMSQARLDEHRHASHSLEEAEPEPRMHMQAMLNMLLSQREALQHACASCEQVFASEVELKRHVTSQQCMVVRKQLAEMSLLKQTLLNSRRDSAEMRVRKRSLSSDFLEELCLEPSTRKKQVSATDQNGHSGNRRKNSRPRKIARDRTVNICEEAHCEEQFTCDVCLVVFQTSGELADHKVIHESVEEVGDAGTCSDKPFTCLLCDKSFSVRQSLSRHLLACHGIDPQEVTNTLKKQIVSNASTDVRKPNISCTDDTAAVTMGSMEFADDQSNKNFYSCEVCIREFNDRSSLWLHMLYAHKEQAMYACGICLKVCMNNSHLMTHWKEHGNVVEQRRYVCQICGRQHDTRKKLVIHVGVHCLDNGQGGTYDPEAIVLQNHAFYNPEQKAKDAEGGVDGNSPECKPEVQTSREAANDFTCEVCYKVFLSEEKLVKHKKNSHKEETSSNTYRGTYQLFFVCELCGSSHHSKSERWRHVYKCHGGEAILRCDRGSCGKVFTTRALRHEHCTNHHQLQGDIPNTCEVCGKLWGSRVDFWKHMMGVHSDLVPLTCGVCLKILCDVPELKAHVKKKHSPLMGDFCCEICGRSYSNKSKMSRHRKIHEVSENSEHLEKSVMSIKKPSKLITGKNESKPCLPKLLCDMCPEQQFTSLSQLAQHRRNVHSLFPCDICTKFYGRTTHLLNHVRRKHKDEPQLSCPVCSKLCSSKVGVSLHIAKNHAPKEEEVKLKKKFPTFKTSKGTYGQKCSFCSKTFWKRLVYRKHMRGCRNKVVVDSSSIQKCELCNVTCSSKTKLLQHIRDQHPDHPNFTCNIVDCSRVMRSLAELELHLKMHTADVGMATCDVCGEVYDSEIKIWRHLYNSHRPRELEGLCGICLRALQTVEELRAHVEATHPGACEKPNTCKLCARTYTGAYKVLLHVAKCHSSYSVCKVCLEMFTDPSQLAAHAELHQDENNHDDDVDDAAAEDSQENSKAEQEAEEQSMVAVPEKRQLLESDEVKTAGKRPKRSYDCELCTRSFHSPSALSDHKKQFHVATPNEFKPYHCNTCFKHFSNKTSYWKHINSPSHASTRRMTVGTTNHGVQKQNELVESQEDSRASYAGSESFDSSHSLQGEENFDQESTHSPSRRRSETRKVYSVDAAVAGPYFCCLCGKKWPGRKHLWQHLIRNHRNEAAVTCGVCLTVCSDYRDLSRHLSVQHPDNFKGDGNNFTCRTCGRYHNARCKLLQHVLIHIVLGPGPEKQPPSLTEIIESRGIKDEGSPCEMSPQMFGDQALASHEQVEVLAVLDESGAENPDFLAADIELSCQHCDMSFDSLEELLKHQDVCQEGMLSVVNGGQSKEPQSLGGDGDLLEESQDSSSQSSLDNVGSPFDSCANDYVVRNSITNNDDDVLPANIDSEVFGDGTALQQELQLNDSALDCIDSGSCENVPRRDVETTEKSDGSPIGDGDMVERSYFEEDNSLGNLSYRSKECIRIGLPIGKKEDSSGREEGKKGIFMDSQSTKMHAYEVGAAVEVTFESDCRDDERCHMVSNGLADSEGSSVETAICELEPPRRAGEKVLLHQGNVANVSMDNLNSLDMLSMIESVDM